MKQILNTALVYISNFMSVNAVMFEQGKGQFFLPSPYAADYDNSIVTQQLKNAPNNSVLHVQDSSLVHYCFAFISNYILLIGPFRVQSLNMDMLPDYLSNDSRLRGKYLHYYYSLPLLSEESVKQSLHLLFVSIYGNSDSIEENTVRIHIYRKNEILIPLDFPDSVSEEIEASELEMAMQLLDQLQSGNTSMALSLYRKIMRQKSSTFVLINTVEGLSTIRTIAKIAMRKAGIPASCILPLLHDFKLAGRNVTSINEARQLSEQLLIQCCDLIKEDRLHHYSHPIVSALNYIHQNLPQSFTIVDLAKTAALSPNAFSSKFREEVGIPPSIYVLKERLKLAARLLNYTNMNIQNICMEIGILDTNYFSRCFKKEYGMAPTAYRKYSLECQKLE